MSDKSQPTSGKVFLVGAGPGDPGLLTLRAVECLGQADLVLYDCLVNSAVLKHVRSSAEASCLGRRDENQRGSSQPEINARMIEAARAGKTVVRLKGGDPMVFGRFAEEAEALSDAQISWEVVPGVTAGLAAAGYAEIPITHRKRSSAVALVTGHPGSGQEDAKLDYGKLASFPGTLVFYMSATSAEVWAKALLQAGKPPETPVIIVRRCTWPDQQTVRCTLATVVEVIAERELRPPTVVLIGEAVAETPEASWFSSRPLFGTRVLVTRPRDGAAVLSDRLAELGADVLLQPTIEISDPADWAPVDAALDRLDQYDWIVFSSVHGVHYFMGRLFAREIDVRRLGSVRLAAVGPSTADKLARYHLRVDLLPEEYRAESLVEALSDDAAGRKFLLVRASRGREILRDGLTAAGAEVDQVVGYNSTDVERPADDVARAMSEGRLDWTTVTSSAIARSLVGMFGDDLRNTKLASISPITSETLRGLGHEPAVEATEHTMPGLIDAILREKSGD